MAVASRETLWPTLDTGYEEEFGPVDPEVHRVARDLWPRAAHLATDLLHDPVAGYGLLKRAVAAVSGLPPDKRERIRDLPAYLFQTYKRLVLAELEKRNGHRKSDIDAAAFFRPATADADRIDRDILIEELVRRMDSWTREVFETLTLGYSFEEISRALDTNPQVVRNRFRLAVRKLAAAVSPTATGPHDRAARLRQTTSSSLSRLRMMRDRLFNPSEWIGRDGFGSS
jgi:DNA-directed RNA polymerase specialized sigma24 family protein